MKSNGNLLDVFKLVVFKKFKKIYYKYNKCTTLKLYL